MRRTRQNRIIPRSSTEKQSSEEIIAHANSSGLLVAGVDEVGRGCLAGPVVAAATILPRSFSDPLIRDSKALTTRQRSRAREMIEKHALSWSVAWVNNRTIDAINIREASLLAMQIAIDGLQLAPDLLLVDGNYFRSPFSFPHECVIHGDALCSSIAAASILAKTYRDEYMVQQSERYPLYGWAKSKGYPTPAHKKSIREHGITPLHRLSFRY